MRSRFAALAAVVLAAGSAVSVWLAASETPKPNGTEDSAIKQLLDRVAKLEARVAQLEERQPRIVVPYAQPPQSVPRDWDRREFNGQTYYIVPLDSPPAGQRSTGKGVR